MFGDRGQVAVEYTMIIGFALLTAIPLTLIFITQTQYTVDSVNAAQSQKAAQDIIAAAEGIAYQGAPSFTTINVNFPDRIQSIALSNHELVIYLKTGNGVEEIVEISSVNLTGEISPGQGKKFIRVEAKSTYVNITG